MTYMDDIVSQRILFSDKEEEDHKDEDEATVSQVEEEAVLGLSKTELIDISGQGIEGQLLKMSRQSQRSVFLTHKCSILKKHLNEVK